MMLESAIKYHRAFTEMSYYDRSYMLCPTNEEWERVEKINTFLVPFYDITNLISGSSDPTSNLYFTQVSLIEVELNDNMSSEDEVIKDMVTRMKTKFNKYGKNYSVTLALGDVLDPTSMLKFVIVCYKRLYPNDYQEKIDRVKEGLYELFGEYVNNLGASSSSLASASRDTPSHSPMSSGTFRSPILEAYHEEMRQNTSNDGESQLDIYLDEPCIVANNIDFLQYWKLNKCRFPQLAIMACDILSIPITIVASESTFSIGGRILHKYKNCLLPENVQALICFKEQNTINVE